MLADEGSRGGDSCCSNLGAAPSTALAAGGARCCSLEGPPTTSTLAAGGPGCCCRQKGPRCLPGIAADACPKLRSDSPPPARHAVFQLITQVCSRQACAVLSPQSHNSLRLQLGNISCATTKLPLQGRAKYFPRCLRCSAPNCLAIGPEQEQLMGTVTELCHPLSLLKGCLVAAVQN